MINYFLVPIIIIFSTSLIHYSEPRLHENPLLNPSGYNISEIHSCKMEDDYLKFNPNEKVTLIGVDDVTSADLIKASNILKNFFRFSVDLKSNVSIDDSYYNSDKRTINPDAFVNNYKPDHKTIFITNKTMFYKSIECRGYTTHKGSVLVVGTGTFLGETLIHEIGHTYGLWHCEDLTCIMAIYNDAYDKGTFCNSCKAKINYH